MHRKLNPKIFLLITILLAIIQVAYYYSYLTQKVAVHFNSSGNADSYGNKTTVMIFQIVIILTLSSVFFLLSKYLHKIPNSLINLPYKNFWLSEKRKMDSLRTISGALLKLIAYTNFLLIAIFQLMIKANINGTDKLSSASYWFLIIYLLLVTIDVVKLYRYFSNTNI